MFRNSLGRRAILGLTVTAALATSMAACGSEGSDNSAGSGSTCAASPDEAGRSNSPNAKIPNTKPPM